MILKLALIFFSLGIIPAFAQESSNPTLAMDAISIPNADFNVVSRDAKIIPLNEIHSVSWQVTIHNDLVYANPNGNAVVRFYDSNVDGKFFEIKAVVGWSVPPNWSDGSSAEGWSVGSRSLVDDLNDLSDKLKSVLYMQLTDHRFNFNQDGSADLIINYRARTTMKEMGKVMAAAREKIGNRAEGGKISQMIKKLLG